MLHHQWHQQCAQLFDTASPFVPQEKTFNLFLPRSHCPHCKQTVWVRDNIPILSFCWLSGRCRHCQQRIAWQYPLVEALCAVMTGVVVWQGGLTVATAAMVLFTWVLLVLAVIDIHEQILPDTLTLPLLWVGLLLSIDHVFVGPAQAILGAVVGYLSLWIVNQSYKLLTGKEGMGYGDFKLFAAFGAWMGVKALLLIILLSSFLGALVGIGLILLKRHQRKSPLAFGPFLVVAGWVCLLWGGPIIQWYFNFGG
jgi:leader peptidase (prepilin peptidase)/N-methyltransferase